VITERKNGMCEYQILLTVGTNLVRVNFSPYPMIWKPSQSREFGCDSARYVVSRYGLGVKIIVMNEWMNGWMDGELD